MDQIESILHKVINELQPGGCASGEIEWDTCLEAMKRYATIKCQEQRKIYSVADSSSYRTETLEDDNGNIYDVLTAPSPDI